MSTRANIVLKDEWKDSELWFYRHSDGYPSVALPPIMKFMKWVVEGKLRANNSQAGGWLIILGANEYGLNTTPTGEGFSGWKVGSIEPTTHQHGDIEYLYTLNLTEKTITIKDIYTGKEQVIDAEEIKGYNELFDADKYNFKD